MPERLHPGVYVEEVSGGVRPIEGVSASTAAFIGEAQRGVPALAQRVTGFAELERAFGGFAPGEAGAWVNDLRIVAGEATSFREDAFRVGVQSIERGAARRLEVFDDVRMDPGHEDHVVERTSPNWRGV